MTLDKNKSNYGIFNLGIKTYIECMPEIEDFSAFESVRHSLRLLSLNKCCSQSNIENFEKIYTN